MKIKKTAAILLALILLILPACANSSKQVQTVPTTAVETTAPFVSAVTEEKRTQEVKDKDGNICFTLDFTLPALAGSADPSILQGELDSIFLSSLSGATTFTANGLASPDKPRTVKGSYEITREGESFVCLRYKTEISPNDGNDNYFSEYGFTFNTKTGKKMNYLDFSATSNPEFTGVLLDNLERQLKSESGYASKYPGRDMIESLLDPEQFFITDTDFCVVFPEMVFAEYKITTNIVSFPLKYFHEAIKPELLNNIPSSSAIQ